MSRSVVIIFSLFAAAAAFASGSGGGGMGGGYGRNQGTVSAPTQPTTAQDWYNVGYNASGKGLFAEAIQDFKTAISLKSDYAEAYNMLGYCSRRMGDMKQSFDYYDTALKLKPNFPQAREYLGEAWLQDGNLAKAVQQYIILQRAGDKNAKVLLDSISDFVNRQP